MGTQPPTPNGAEAHPIFGPSLLWPNGCMDQDATWYRDRPRPTRHCVRCGAQKKGTPTSTQFLAHVYCGQMARWMKTPLGTEVDLDPGHIVQEGVPAPAKGAQQPPIFGSCLLWSRSPISVTAELFLRYASRKTDRHRDTLIAILSTSPGRVTMQTTSVRNTYTVHIRDLYENCSLSHSTAANKFCHPHLPLRKVSRFPHSSLNMSYVVQISNSEHCCLLI